MTRAASSAARRRAALEAECLALASDYLRIRSRTQQKLVRELVHAMAELSQRQARERPRKTPR